MTRVNANIRRVALVPANKAAGQVVWIHRVRDEQAFCKGKCHLSVISETASRQSSFGHFSFKVINRSRREKFQRHAKRIANSSADCDPP